MKTCMKGVAWDCMQMELCGVVEWMNRNTLWWFVHIERKKSGEFVKKVYVSEIVGPRKRGRPVIDGRIG